MEIEDIKPGDKLSNKELYTTFKVSNAGGMRKNNRDNILVLIADYTKPDYKDKWKGKILHYTGMGREGDQDLYYNQNKTLAQSDMNGVEIHLFEVFNKYEYTYKGIVRLAGEPYTELQRDIRGNMRKVWMFPLEVVE